MDNVSFDFVLQHIVHLRLKYSNWGFVFKEAVKVDVSHCHFLDNSVLIELGVKEIIKKKNCFFYPMLPN